MWRVLLLTLGTPALADSVVATRDIAAGAIIVPDDLTTVAMEIPDAIGELDAAIGYKALTDISAGRALSADQITRPLIIERNARVTLSFQMGTLEIRTEGRALGTGGIGDTIEIMNLSSRARLVGRIGADGAVHIASGS
jgi:flagellar basal body P-ring formation protein FlgA